MHDVSARDPFSYQLYRYRVWHGVMDKEEIGYQVSIN